MFVLCLNVFLMLIPNILMKFWNLLTFRCKICRAYRLHTSAA